MRRGKAAQEIADGPQQEQPRSQSSSVSTGIGQQVRKQSGHLTPARLTDFPWIEAQRQFIKALG